MYSEARFGFAGELIITCHAVHFEEFGAMENIIQQTGIAPRAVPLPIDVFGREVREYSIPPLKISQLEDLLHGTFQPNGTFVPSTTTQGNPYACREVLPPGTSRTASCETIMADNDQGAQSACSLVAGGKRWFSGDARPGTCP